MPSKRASTPFLLLVCASLFAIAHPVHAVDDPFTRWTFDAANGNDATTSALHLAAGGPVAYVNGRSGLAARLAGSSAYFERGSDPAFAPGSDGWTMYAWVLAKPDPGNLRMVLSWYRCGADPACTNADAALYWLYLGADGRPTANFRDDAAHDATVTGPVTVTDARWHLLVATLDATLDRVRLYVDGVAVKESTTTMGPITAGGHSIPLSVGRIFRQGWGVPGEYFKGSLDDVRLYRRALSAAEVTALYAGGIVGAEPVAVASVLGPAVPNPSRRGASMRVSLARPAHLRLTVFDVLGRRVRKLVDGPRDAGEFVEWWDGTDERGIASSPGVYFVRMEIDGERVARASEVTIAR